MSIRSRFTGSLLAIALITCAATGAWAWSYPNYTHDQPYDPANNPAYLPPNPAFDIYNDPDLNNVARDAVCYMDGVIPNYTTGGYTLRQGKNIKHSGSQLIPQMNDCPFETMLDGGKLVGTDYKASRKRITNIPTNDPNIVNPADMHGVLGRGIYNFSTGAYEHAPTYVGVRARALVKPEQSLTPIDAWNICRYVNNYTNQDIFIPLRTKNEWYSFTTNAPTGVEITPCALYCKGNCEAHGLFYGDTFVNEDLGDFGLKRSTTELPYAKMGKTFPQAQNHDADNAGSTGEALNTRTFSNLTCYKYTKEDPHCFGNIFYEKICDAIPTDCKVNCNCSAYYHYSDVPSCDGKWGTLCKQTPYEWTEVFVLHVKAGAAFTDYDGIENGIQRNNGWEFGSKDYPAASKRVSGERPSECAQSEADMNWQDDTECKPGKKPPPPPCYECGGGGGGDGGGGDGGGGGGGCN